MPDRISNMIAQAEQAIEANPEHCDAYWQLGLLHLLQGDEEQAQAVWWSGMMVATEADMTVLLNLLRSEADRQQTQGRCDLAESLYRQGIALQEDQAEIHVGLGQAVALQGRLDEAIEHWQQAIELAPNWHEPHFRQGQVWEKVDQPKQAVTAYQQAQQQHWQPEAAAGLGRCYLKLAEWAEAIEVLQFLAEQQPSSAILIDLGWGWLRSGNLAQAIQCFHQALWQQSNFAETYCAWIQELTHQGRAKPEQVLQAELLQQIALAETAKSIAPFAKAFNQLVDRRSQKSAAASSSPTRGTPLISFYETTETWAAEQPKPDRYIPLEPPSRLTLSPPQSIDPDLHFSFRYPHQIPLPGAFVAQIPQGQIWSTADQSSVAIFTAEHQLLGDLSAEFPLLEPGHPDQHPSRHSALSRPLPPIQQIDGTVAVLSGLTDDMYFHWMLEVLPRIHLLQRSGLLETIDHFLVHHHLSFQQQTLEHLGIPADRILAIDGEIHLQATTLIAPSFPASPAWMPRWACDFLRRSFLENPAISGDRRLYLSRQATANRRLINESAVWSVLEQFGFEAVTLEALSVTQQAELLAQAAVVISPHGSGLTNLVFCSPGTKVIELFSPDFVYPCYWLLSNWLQLEYAYFTGTTPLGSGLQPLFYPNPRLADIWIEVEQLEMLLKQVLTR